MNLHRLLNMMLNILTHRLVNFVLNRGLGAARRARKVPGAGTSHDAQDARALARRARQAAKIARRFGR